MATQTLPHVVQFPQSVPAVEPITQLELELFLSLRNRLKQLESQVAIEEAGLKSRLEAGATVVSGVHVIELKESFRRHVSWKDVVVRLATRLKMDGAGYCARVLAGTRPTRTVSLIVE
jgi:hypothetical protein